MSLPPPGVTALYELKCTQNLTYRPSPATSRWLPVNWHHSLVTSNHKRSRHVISCHVTATFCDLQPSRSSNVLKTWLVRLLQPPPGDFRSNDVTSGSLPTREVTRRHFLSCDSDLLRVTALLELKHTQHLTSGLVQQLPGDFRSNDVTSESLPVTWAHVTTFPVTWLPPPASYSLVGNEMYSICQFSALYSYFQVTSAQITSLPGHFWSPEVM